MKPLVSVAVITYNMERYLRPLLDSILKQKVSFPYEIVIDDDHSPDNSREIILEYASKYPEIVKPSLRDHNVGGSRNMYGVMQQCRGKYIAILEGDDFWEADDKLQYQIIFLEAHPEYIGMTCNSWCEHGEEASFTDKMRNRTEPKVFTYADFMARHFHDRLPSSTDTWVFRNIFKEYPKDDFSLFYKAHNMIWDQSLILMLYGKGSVYADPRLVSHHRSVTRMDGTNYQSLILQKNCLYGDSQMYQAMEEYIEHVLKRDCAPFYLVRGDVWIDAVFRAMLSHRKEDWDVERKIWKDQKSKAMLAKLFAEKAWDIVKRKAVPKQNVRR